MEAGYVHLYGYTLTPHLGFPATGLSASCADPIACAGITQGDLRGCHPSPVSPHKSYLENS